MFKGDRYESDIILVWCNLIYVDSPFKINSLIQVSKVEIRLQATGDAPIMKKRNYMVKEIICLKFIILGFFFNV